MEKTVLSMSLSVTGALVASVAVWQFQEMYLETKPQEQSVFDAWRKQYRCNLLCILIGLSGGFLFVQYGYGPLEILRRFLVLYTVIAIAKVDRKKYIIPNKAVLFLFGVQTVLLVLGWFWEREDWPSVLLSSLLGCFIGGITFLVGYIISRKGMGLGDVKLLAGMGFCLGDAAIVPVILLSLIFSAAYGIVQIVRKRLKARDEVPYAPFAACAAVILLLLGF